MMVLLMLLTHEQQSDANFNGWVNVNVKADLFRLRFDNSMACLDVKISNVLN